MKIRLRQIFLLSFLLLMFPFSSLVNAEDVGSNVSSVKEMETKSEDNIKDNVIEEIVNDKEKIAEEAKGDEKEPQEALTEGIDNQEYDLENSKETNGDQLVELEEKSQENKTTKDTEDIKSQEDKLEDSEETSGDQLVELEEKNQEDKTEAKDTEDIKGQEVEVKESNSEDLNLELGENLIQPAVRGGSSGGGGGSSGGSGGSGMSTRYGSPAIEIRKVDENGNPIQVAFKITNKNTGESHIIVMDKEGKNNRIYLDGISVRPHDLPFLQDRYLDSYYQYTVGGSLAKDYANYKEEDFKKIEEFLKANEMPNIFEKKDGGIWVVPPMYPPDQDKDPKDYINKNDEFLDKTADETYKIEDFYDDDLVYFKDIVKGKGKIILKIFYGYTKPIDPSNPRPMPMGDPEKIEGAKWFIDQKFEYKNVDIGDSTDLMQYWYGNINGKNVEKYSKNFFINYMHNEGKKITGRENIYIYYHFIAEDIPTVYEVEELRTDSNQNYALKNFYIKKDTDGKYTIGSDIDNINKQFDIIENKIEVPLPPDGEPLPPDMPKYWIIRYPSTTIENEKFKFETNASNPDKQDEKEVSKSTTTSILDNIKYDKLSVGKSYTFKGKLIHKKSGEEVQTLEPIIYETGKLISKESLENGINIKISFDASKYDAGDEFVILYDIYEDGVLAGYEDDINNPLQSFKIVDQPVTPPEEETPPPEEETPPPGENTPPGKETPSPGEKIPPKKELPPFEEETNPKKEIVPKEIEVTYPKVEQTINKEEKSLAMEVEKPYKNNQDRSLPPKTYDPGMGISW